MHYRFRSKAVFKDLEGKIQKGCFGKLNSFLLYADHENIAEYYFNGYNANTLHEFQSVTKSLQSILVGIALDKGYLKSIDVPIKVYFDDLPDIEWSNGKDKITVRHLLQMTAGLDWNEGHTSYMSLQNHSNLMAWSSNWIEYALSRPMLCPPGERFIYSSANPIIISAIFNKVYPHGHEAFITKCLFAPLEIKRYGYHRSESAPNILADVDILPKDMAKIALMLSQNGVYQGQKLLSANWVDLMLTTKADIGKENLQYGYGWWHKYVEVLGVKYACTYAWGYGSQHIFFVKELGLFMVCTGKNYEVTLHQGPFDLMRAVIELAIGA